MTDCHDGPESRPQDHRVRGRYEINIRCEDVKRAADANAVTVDATLAMIVRTSDKDRADHPAEYAGEAVHQSIPA